MKAKRDHPLAILRGQAYGRLASGRNLVGRCETLRRSSETSFTVISRAYEWFLAPLSLWPLNMQDLLESVLEVLEKNKKLPAALSLILNLLPPPPVEDAIRSATAHEHDVQIGHYEHLVKVADAKFLAEEKELANSRELRSDWRRIQATYQVKEFADHKGVIRRSMISERNLRSDFSFDWSDQSHRFRATFDAFCAKWNLYGMQNNKPLLLKLSVNLTAFGTMIFIPSYWSLDLKRDLNSSAISQLHRARVPHRQGPAIAENKLQRRKLARKLHALDVQAKADGLRGDQKRAFLCLGLHPETDSRQFARLRKEFPTELS